MRVSALVCAAVGLLATGSIVIVASLARAGDPPPPIPDATLTLAREVVDELDADHHAAAVERLDPDACTALAAAPSAAYDVAVAVTRACPAALVLDPTSAAALIERLRGLSTADDPSPHAAGVRAIRSLLLSLTGRLHGTGAPLADLRAVVVTLRKLESKVPALDRVYAAALEVAQVVAAARSSDADAWGAVLAAADPLRKSKGDDAVFAHTVASAELQWGLLAPAADAPTARQLLERSLGTFIAWGWAEQRENGEWPPDAGLFNRALTAAKNLGGAAKIAYMSGTFKSRTGALSANVPVLSGWTWTYGESDQDSGKLVRDRPVGGKIEIQIWGYNGSTEYTMADGSVIPGENIDGFLKKAMKDDRDSLTKLSRDIRTSGPLSATIKESKGYDLKGLDTAGVPTRYRDWYFKYSRLLKRYFAVCLTQSGAYSEKDPELLFLLDSIEEQVETR